jgi:hypothetical protein
VEFEYWNWLYENSDWNSYNGALRNYYLHQATLASTALQDGYKSERFEAAQASLDDTREKLLINGYYGKTAANAKVWEEAMLNSMPDAAVAIAGLGVGGKRSNEIGNWAAQAVADNLPIEVGQFVDARNGRRYDGRFKGNPSINVEIKGSVNGSVSLDSRIRSEVVRDGQLPIGERPTWIFVNSRPSAGLQELLYLHGVAWHALHVAPQGQ